MIDKRDLLVISLLSILLISVGIYAVYMTSTKSGKCLANPLSYGADVMKKSSMAEVICSCTLFKESYQSSTIYFNEKGFIIKNGSEG